MPIPKKQPVADKPRIYQRAGEHFDHRATWKFTKTQLRNEVKAERARYATALELGVYSELRGVTAVRRILQNYA